MEAMPTLTDALRNAVSGSISLEYIVGVVVAIAILRMEIIRTAVNMPEQSGGARSFARYKKLLQQYAPETAGLLSLFAMAAALRVQGSMAMASIVDENGDGGPDEAGMKAMADIARQWPILLGADTLLSLQAMLRLLVLMSSALRLGGGPSLITQETAAIACGAAMSRAALAARTNDYMLDGPLGGNLPVAVEFLSVIFLVILCRGIRRHALMTACITLLTAAWIASRNRLNLAGDTFSDGLFLFANIAELLAGFAYLSRGLLLDIEAEGGTRGSVALRFAHIIMPVQACMSAYYFVQAFEVVPQLIGAGHPFEILQCGCVAQVGAYAAAALLHWAESLEPHGSFSDMPQRTAAPTVL